MTDSILDQSFTLEPHARFRVHDNEGIFVLQDAGEVLVVNRVAAFIVEKLKESRSVSEAAEAVADHFDVTLEVARQDATKIVTDLVDAGALAPR